MVSVPRYENYSSILIYLPNVVFAMTTLLTIIGIKQIEIKLIFGTPNFVIFIIYFVQKKKENIYFEFTFIFEYSPKLVED